MNMLKRMLGSNATPPIEAALGAGAMQAGLNTLSSLAHAQRVLAGPNPD